MKPFLSHSSRSKSASRALRRGMSLLCVAAAALLIAGPVGAQSIIYVDTDATGTNDGTSWANAFVYLQDALAVAQAGDEVWVAEGVYRPDQGAGIVPGDREVSFVVGQGVSLLGGFRGEEAARDQANWLVAVTVLSGDLLGDDSGSMDANEPSRIDNAYTVVRLVGAGMSLIGFVIEGGHGGTREEGGGLQSTQGVEFSISRVLFRHNFAKRGGGAFIRTGLGPELLSGVEFYENVATSYGGGCAVEGTLVFRDAAFQNNAAGVLGGGLHAGGYVSLVDAMFDHNSTTLGGGLYLSSIGHLRMMNTRFTGNRAEAWGGAISLDESLLTAESAWITNSVFSGNEASSGGAIHAYQSAVEVVNSTFSNNIAGVGGGGAVALLGNDSRVAIRNTILWNNSDGVDNDEIDVPDTPGARGRSTIAASAIMGDLPPGLEVQGGVIAADPAFIDELGADGVVGSPDDDLRLTVNSPVIDLGLAEYLPADWADLDQDLDLEEPVPGDLAGNVRVFDGGLLLAPDLGAFEYGAVPLVTRSGPNPSSFRNGNLRLEVYPTPFASQFSLSCIAHGLQGPALVRIFDTLGREVLARLIDCLDPGTIEFQAHHWAPGVYLIRAEMGAASANLPIIRVQ